MIHFSFLLLFAAVTAVGFGIFSIGDRRQQTRHGIKIFLQFVGIGFVLAWICYFLPS